LKPYRFYTLIDISTEDLFKYLMHVKLANIKTCRKLIHIDIYIYMPIDIKKYVVGYLCFFIKRFSFHHEEYYNKKRDE